MSAVPMVPLKPSSATLERQAQLAAFERRPKAPSIPGEKRSAPAPIDDFAQYMPGAWRDETYQPALRPAPQATPWPEAAAPRRARPPAPPVAPPTPQEICGRHALGLAAVQVDLFDEITEITTALAAAEARVPGLLRTMAQLALRATVPVSLGLTVGVLIFALPLGATVFGLVAAAAAWFALREGDPVPPARLPETAPQGPALEVLLATRPRLAVAKYERQLAVSTKALTELKRARRDCADLAKPNTTTLARLYDQASESHKEATADLKLARALIARQKQTSRMLSLGAATGTLALLNLFGDMMGPLAAVWRGATTATSYFWVDSSLRSVSGLWRPSVRALEDYVTVREGELELLEKLRTAYVDAAAGAGTPLVLSRWQLLKALAHEWTKQD